MGTAECNISNKRNVLPKGLPRFALVCLPVVIWILSYLFNRELIEFNWKITLTIKSLAIECFYYGKR